jgi:hypothetical protein
MQRSERWEKIILHKDIRSFFSTSDEVNSYFYWQARAGENVES